MRILCNFLVISVILRITRCDSIRVDGFFEDGDGSAVRTFRHTMDKLKLPLMARKIDLTYFSTRVNYGDSFDVSKKVCDAVSRGSKVIFGIHSRSSSDFINSLCDQLSIPHIQMYWEPRDVVTNTKNPNRNSMTLNLHPLYSSIALKHRELVKKWQWKNIAVLYENNDGLIRLQDVLKLSHLPDSTVLTYKIDQNPENMKKIFTTLKDSWINHIVIDCHYTRVKEILNQAKTEKVLTEYYHFHFTTLDLGVVDLSDFAGYRANITSLRLVDPNDPQVSQMTFDWKTELFSDNAINSPLDRKHKIMPTESALMYDAVDVFGKALIKLVENMPPPFMFDQRLACNLSNTWDQGAQLFRHMKTLKFKGLTGKVEFSEFNERTAFMLNVTKVINGDLKQIGIWNPENSLILDKMEQTDLGNINLTIVTVEDPPYVIINENGQYDGFCIDILKNMSQRRNFTYHIILGNFGNCNESGCTGLYKTLVDKKADMAVGGFTITSARDKYVDFTKPFWNLGITILFRKSKPEQPHLFSFLHPFHRDVWIYTIAIYLAVSFMFFAIARLTPYEWCNPYPCEPSADIVENQFSVLNSMWLTIGSFLQQGCELSPRTVSTRIVAGVWWFFTLIIISSYTANLAAFLTAGRMKSPISNAADLAKQEEIKYGTFRGGATSTFFKNSQLPLYQRMHAFMKKTPSAFVGSNSEGEQRVLEGGYAYFAESTTVEYLKQRNCELMEIGQWLDSKGYGFPLPRGSIYRDMISSEIIYMQDYQIMRHLYNKWWTEYNITTPCSPEKKKADASLSVSNVGGVFVVLVIVTILSVFVAFIEFIWYFYTEGDRKEPLFTKMRKEIIFALKVFGPSSRVMNRKGNDGITDNGHTNNYVT